MKKLFGRLYKCCKLQLQRNNLLCNVCSTFSLNYMAGREGFTPLHDVTLQFIKPGRLRSTFTFKNCNKMPVSKQEQHIYNVIRSNYKPKEILQSFRPNFLKNEKTGKNPAHRIGFEFRGSCNSKKGGKYAK